MWKIGNALHNSVKTFSVYCVNIFPFLFTASADIFDRINRIYWIFIYFQFPACPPQRLLYCDGGKKLKNNQSPAANNQKLWISVHIRINVRIQGVALFSSLWCLRPLFFLWFGNGGIPAPSAFHLRCAWVAAVSPIAKSWKILRDSANDVLRKRPPPEWIRINGIDCLNITLE